MIDATQQKHALWHALAELFFLDTEPDEQDFKRVATLIQQAGWSRQDTFTALVELISPIASGNLGFMRIGFYYPVIGEWAGFEQADLCQRIERRAALRQSRPRWHFYLEDRFARRLLKKLEAQRLLDQLPEE